MKFYNRIIVTVTILLVLASCSANKEVVVVYSPHGPEVLGDYEKRFEEAYPEVDVQWLYLGSKQVYERVRAEKNRPAADIWWGAPSSLFMQAVEEDLLAAYQPSWAAENPKIPHDANDLWYGTYASPLGIVYNENGHNAEDMPKTWDGLLDDKWKDKITIRMPHESGTMRTFIGATMIREGGDEAGVEWLRKLHASTATYMQDPQKLFDHMKRNPELISVWLYPDIPLQRERNGYPLRCVIPDQTPVIVDCIAIVNKAPHREWAEKFYEFVTTKEALAHQAQAYWKMPLRKDIDPAELPPEMTGQEFTAQELDWPTFAENENRWAVMWQEQVKAAQ